MSISILVVEDQAELRRTIEDLLVRAGYVVRCAKDTEEAISVLETMARPCLLLWDPVTARPVTAPMSFSLTSQAAFKGISIATIPVGVALHGGDAAKDLPPQIAKRLTSPDAIMSMVKEHCAEPA